MNRRLARKVLKTAINLQNADLTEKELRVTAASMGIEDKYFVQALTKVNKSSFIQKRTTLICIVLVVYMFFGGPVIAWLCGNNPHPDDVFIITVLYYFAIPMLIGFWTLIEYSFKPPTGKNW